MSSARAAGAVTDTAGLRALALANARYWPTVAPHVRGHLRHWRARAAAIPDPSRRALALEKLARERFNVSLAATLATLAPRRARARAVAMMVALQVAYDYLDALTELPSPDPIGAGERMYAPWMDLFGERERERERERARAPGGAGRGANAGDEYLGELTAAVAEGFARLPSARAVAPVARAAAARCAQAQILAHAAPVLGIEPAERWARQRAAATAAARGVVDVADGVDGVDGVDDGDRNGPGAGARTGSAAGWPELLAGGQASVLSLHALIALAARAGVSETQARAMDEAYETIGALSMLDGLVDREEDEARGAISYAGLYEDPAAMGRALAAVAREGLRRAGGLEEAGHHAVTLTGVVACYAADPRAREAPAREVFAAVESELGGLLAPTLALMRGWRWAAGGGRKTRRMRTRGRAGCE